jgi:hypothetical protein
MAVTRKHTLAINLLADHPNRDNISARVEAGESQSVTTSIWISRQLERISGNVLALRIATI